MRPMVKGAGGDYARTDKYRTVRRRRGGRVEPTLPAVSGDTGAVGSQSQFPHGPCAKNVVHGLKWDNVQCQRADEARAGDHGHGIAAAVSRESYRDEGQHRDAQPPLRDAGTRLDPCFPIDEHLQLRRAGPGHAGALYGHAGQPGAQPRAHDPRVAGANPVPFGAARSDQADPRGGGQFGAQPVS